MPVESIVSVTSVGWVELVPASSEEDGLDDAIGNDGVGKGFELAVSATELEEL